MNSSTSMPPDALGNVILSVALIGPTDSRRKSLAAALASLHGSVTREFAFYPEMDDVPRLLEAEYDVVIVELDSNPEYALELVENVCGNSSVTVMVYSEQVFPEMLVRCMRAGAREFLTQPITASTIAEAMVRASVRRPAMRSVKKPTGKLMVFVGAKGGSGVTTVASNFAVSLARESGRNTALIDLNLPFGNAALDLGLTPQYSTANALLNVNRLDSNYLSTLLDQTHSGLSVLAAPDKYANVQVTEEAVERLLSCRSSGVRLRGGRCGVEDLMSIGKSLFDRGVDCLPRAAGRRHRTAQCESSDHGVVQIERQPSSRWC